MSHAFHKLVVDSIIEETADSRSFLLTLPEDLTESYTYKAGQYLTVKVSVKGEEQRRAYSIFTAPRASEFGFTVKRVTGGLVSNYLIDEIKVGDTLSVMMPDGKFTIKPNSDSIRDHYFIAGGSGITPVIAMISELLEAEPMSTCYLLYANRDEANIIFRNQLDQLAETYAGQFYLDHILSQPQQNKAAGLKGLFGVKSSPTWKGMKGRINPQLLEKYFEDRPSKSNENIYYLCGPGGLIETMEAYLTGLSTSTKNIKKEYFTSSKESAALPLSDSNGATATVLLNGEKFTLTIPPSKNILDAIIDDGKDPPYSCTSGACSTCVAKLTSGKVDMEACFALDDEEIEDGYILTCQARPTTSEISLDFES